MNPLVSMSSLCCPGRSVSISRTSADEKVLAAREAGQFTEKCLSFPATDRCLQRGVTEDGAVLELTWGGKVLSPLPRADC